MSHPDAVFVSLAEIDRPEHHRAYNEWHHLDHLPENRVLDGVHWGERWVRTPAARDAALVATAPYDSFHYLTLYWFLPPVGPSISAWTDLADRSFQWGRRPELGWTSRPFMGFFRPILGYAAPRAEVTPEVLPLRPNLGAYVVLSDVTNDPAARPELQARNRWYDREGLPALLERPGIAGGWTFDAEERLAPAEWARREARRGAPDSDATSLRLTVLFLDEDPITVAGGLGLDDVVAPDAGDLETVRFAGPLEVIRPWDYGWFDDDAASGTVAR